MRAMPARPPRPSDQMRTIVAATVTRAEAQRLRALADAQAIPMTTLVRKALESFYGTVKEPKAGG